MCVYVRVSMDLDLIGLEVCEDAVDWLRAGSGTSVHVVSMMSPHIRRESIRRLTVSVSFSRSCLPPSECFICEFNPHSFFIEANSGSLQEIKETGSHAVCSD